MYILQKNKRPCSFENRPAYVLPGRTSACADSTAYMESGLTDSKQHIKKIEIGIGSLFLCCLFHQRE